MLVETWKGYGNEASTLPEATTTTSESQQQLLLRKRKIESEKSEREKKLQDKESVNDQPSGNAPKKKRKKKTRTSRTATVTSEARRKLSEAALSELFKAMIPYDKTENIPGVYRLIPFKEKQIKIPYYIPKASVAELWKEYAKEKNKTVVSPSTFFNLGALLYPNKT
mmetsp:Transcript_13547/g.16814  ORF Transcript_13547/g.16814 Transcript_13547/m.16814 type:complete len:167 (+) Transcript_13547:235-735(+)